ncbi:hypothetical protein HK405_013152, partial [Cladochytrium tenue]
SEIEDLFPLVSELPRLNRLDVTPFFMKGAGLVKAPAAWPRITVLRIAANANEVLTSLAAACRYIESLELNDDCDPIGPLCRTLNNAGTNIFAGLRNLKIRSFAKSFLISSADLRRMFEACPAIETLDITLQCGLESLLPLHDLSRLQCFIFTTDFDARPDLIGEAADLAARDLPVGKGFVGHVRVFLHNLASSSGQPHASVLRAMAEAQRRAGDRLQVVEAMECLPRAFD